MSETGEQQVNKERMDNIVIQVRLFRARKAKDEEYKGK